MDNFLTYKEMTDNELLEIFSPECLPVIKKNLNSRKRDLKKIEVIAKELLEKVYQGIYADKNIHDMARDKFWLPNAKWFWYDRYVDPVKEEIKTLERLLRLSQIKTSGINLKEIDLGRIKQIPITNFIKTNSSNFAKCPFSSEKTPSFHINKNKNRFHCFSCGADGDVIDLYMKLFNVDFRTAINDLNRQ